MKYGMFEGKRIDNGEVVQGMLIEYGGSTYIQTMLGQVKKNEGEFDYRFGNMTVTSCAYAVEPDSIVQTLFLPSFENNYEYGFESRFHDVTDDDKSGLLFLEKEDGTYCVGGYCEKEDIPSELVIPNEHNGKPITSIGYRAFFECKNLTSVVIPDSVIDVGEEAFKYSGLKGNVVIPKNVKRIGDEAFMCPYLNTITLFKTSIAGLGKNISNLLCEFVCVEPNEVDELISKATQTCEEVNKGKVSDNDIAMEKE